MRSKYSHENFYKPVIKETNKKILCVNNVYILKSVLFEEQLKRNLS